MPQSKPTASLSPALLVRKGGAQPSPQGSAEGQTLADADVVPISRSGLANGKEVLRQQVRLADAYCMGPVRPRRRRSASLPEHRSAFTLRLDEERHLRLRLACTATGQSAQQVVTEALDRLLADLPELDAIVDELRRHRN